MNLRSLKKRGISFFIVLALLLIIVFFPACSGVFGDDDNGGGDNSGDTTITTDDTTSDLTGIYVSTAGDDSNSGEAASPVKTISKAVTMLTSTRNHIYVAIGTYSEIVEIISDDPVVIKGGYNATTWERINTSDMSTIGGDDTLQIVDMAGGRVVALGSDPMLATAKLTLENLIIMGVRYTDSPSASYSDAIGVTCMGDLTVDNCHIVGLDSGTVSGVAAAIMGMNVTINSGVITGITGDATADRTGAISAVTLTINGGTMTGASGSATIDSYIFAVGANGIMEIRGGTIVGIAGSSVTLTDTPEPTDLYGIRARGETTISNCKIYGKEYATPTISGTFDLLNRDNTTDAKFNRGTEGSAEIHDVYGDGVNYWTTPPAGWMWDNPF